VKIDGVVVATAVSWLGLWVHELYRVPRLLGFTPDGDLFMLPIAAGLAFWWSRSRGAPAAWALTIYAAVNLAGRIDLIRGPGGSDQERTFIAKASKSRQSRARLPAGTRSVGRPRQSRCSQLVDSDKEKLKPQRITT
jgi:hypothetical protein